MSDKNITFRLAAYSDPAGKYTPDHPMRGNEDNFIVDADLTDGMTGSFNADTTINLGPSGCLMVVADGMGGMNAGEVASEIAIATVRDLFGPGKISADISATPDSRRRYMEQVIREADRRVKADAAANAEHAEMGSTMIMVWILGSELTVSWIGDSRAYRYNPVNGIEMLSEDHSYVQDLVRKGILTYEQTFDHPQGNIVTRSLGDPSGDAQPESRQYTINTGDVIIVCSDGLSGVLRDCRTLDENGIPYPGDNIQSIVAAHQDSMTACREALWKAAEEAGWYDNVTVILCQILGGAPAAVRKAAAKPEIVVQAQPIQAPAAKAAPAPAATAQVPKAPGGAHHSSPSKRYNAGSPTASVQRKGTGTNPRTLIYASIGIVFIIAAILFIVFSRGGNEDTPVTPLDQLIEQPETQIAGATAAETERPERRTERQNGKNDAGEAQPAATSTGNAALDAAMKVEWKRTALSYLTPILNNVPQWKDRVEPLYNKILKAKRADELSTDAFVWNMNYNYLLNVRNLKAQVGKYPHLVTECNALENEILQQASRSGTSTHKRWGQRIGEITAIYDKAQTNAGNNADAIKGAMNK